MISGTKATRCRSDSPLLVGRAKMPPVLVTAGPPGCVVVVLPLMILHQLQLMTCAMLARRCAAKRYAAVRKRRILASCAAADSSGRQQLRVWRKARGCVVDVDTTGRARREATATNASRN